MQAAHVGVARNVSAIRDARPLEDGRRDHGWETHIHGAIVEQALAKALDVYWHPAVGRLDTETGDVAGYQAKAITHPAHSLIVRKHDDARFSFVLGLLEDERTVRLLGWLPGAEATVDRYWREVDPARGVHRAAYFVPQSALRSIETLAGARTAA